MPLSCVRFNKTMQGEEVLLKAEAVDKMTRR